MGSTGPVIAPAPMTSTGDLYLLFHEACPTAYTYPYDDEAALFGCTNTGNTTGPSYNVTCRSRRDGDRYANDDGHRDRHGHHSDVDSYGDRHCYHGDDDSYGDRESYGDCHSHRDCNGDRNRDRDRNRYDDCHRDANCHHDADNNGHADGNRNATAAGNVQQISS